MGQLVCEGPLRLVEAIRQQTDCVDFRWCEQERSLFARGNEQFQKPTARAPTRQHGDNSLQIELIVVLVSLDDVFDYLRQRRSVNGQENTFDSHPYEDTGLAAILIVAIALSLTSLEQSRRAAR